MQGPALRQVLPDGRFSPLAQLGPHLAPDDELVLAQAAADEARWRAAQPLVRPLCPSSVACTASALPCCKCNVGFVCFGCAILVSLHLLPMTAHSNAIDTLQAARQMDMRARQLEAAVGSAAAASPARGGPPLMRRSASHAIVRAGSGVFGGGVFGGTGLSAARGAQLQGISGMERPNNAVLGQLLHAPNSLASSSGGWLAGGCMSCQDAFKRAVRLLVRQHFFTC